MTTQHCPDKYRVRLRSYIHKSLLWGLVGFLVGGSILPLAAVFFSHLGVAMFGVAVGVSKEVQYTGDALPGKNFDKNVLLGADIAKKHVGTIRKIEWPLVWIGGSIGGLIGLIVPYRIATSILLARLKRDFTFNIVEDKRAEDGSRLILATSDNEGATIGLQVIIMEPWSRYVWTKSDYGGYNCEFSGCVTIASIGDKTDELIRQMDRVYEVLLGAHTARKETIWTATTGRVAEESKTSDFWSPLGKEGRLDITLSHKLTSGQRAKMTLRREHTSNILTLSEVKLTFRPFLVAALADPLNSPEGSAASTARIGVT